MTRPPEPVSPRESETPTVTLHEPVVPGTVFPEHRLAHELLDGFTGLEIGAAAHNPFGLKSRNVAIQEGWDFYAREQRALGVEPARVDLWASGDAIPVPDGSEDYVISSHVLEHLPNPVGALLEWNRVVRDQGYVFMIVPIKGVLPADGPRELTSLAHFIDCYRQGHTLDSHPIDDVPGGRMGHYHTFTPDSLTDVVDWMRETGLCEWELVAREDIDSKVGNGFTLVFRVHHPR
jgi:SAM-dependent methyltransferase